MRTTLTFDPDVAATLKRVQTSKGLTLKAAVNEAMRRGLQAMEEPEATRAPYQTPADDLGKCLIGNLDDVAEALAYGEGDAFR
jgi:hypothetical protein